MYFLELSHNGVKYLIGHINVSLKVIAPRYVLPPFQKWDLYQYLGVTGQINVLGIANTVGQLLASCNKIILWVTSVSYCEIV